MIEYIERDTVDANRSLMSELKETFSPKYARIIKQARRICLIHLEIRTQSARVHRIYVCVRAQIGREAALPRVRAAVRSSRERDRLIDRYIKVRYHGRGDRGPTPSSRSKSWIPTRDPAPTTPKEIQIKNRLYYQIALVKYSAS